MPKKATNHVTLFWHPNLPKNKMETKNGKDNFGNQTNATFLKSSLVFVVPKIRNLEFNDWKNMLNVIFYQFTSLTVIYRNYSILPKYGIVIFTNKIMIYNSIKLVLKFMKSAVFFKNLSSKTRYNQNNKIK